MPLWNVNCCKLKETKTLQAQGKVLCPLHPPTPHSPIWYYLEEFKLGALFIIRDYQKHLGLSIWQCKILITVLSCLIFFPSEAPSCLTSFLAQNAMYTSILLSVPKILMHVGSLTLMHVHSHMFVCLK